MWRRHGNGICQLLNIKRATKYKLFEYSNARELTDMRAYRFSW
jgi:hypothetical protein